mgnify:CR=1 FL=1
MCPPLPRNVLEERQLADVLPPFMGVFCDRVFGICGPRGGATSSRSAEEGVVCQGTCTYENGIQFSTFLALFTF